MDTRTVTIVGGSVAGVHAAETLRSEGFDGRIVLVSADDALPYDRPPLSKKFITDGGPVEDIALRPPSFYESNAIELMTGRKALRLIGTERSVELDDGSLLASDNVILATGGRARRLQVPGADRAGVFVLRDAVDAANIRDALATASHVVVIGGGFIGAEAAASARTVGCDVAVLELAEPAVGGRLPNPIATRLRIAHENAGVELHGSMVVDRIEGDGRVEAVVTDDGQRFAADVVIVGIGIEPNVELAETAGLTVDNGIVVDDRFRTSLPEVLAAGDVANRYSPRVGRRVRCEHWQNAIDQGRSAALSVLGREPCPDTPWIWSDQHDVSLHIAGVIDGYDDVVWRGDLDGDGFTGFLLAAGKVIGACGINRPKDVRAGLQMVVDGRSLPRDVLADETVDLRKALRGAT